MLFRVIPMVLVHRKCILVILMVLVHGDVYKNKVSRHGIIAVSTGLGIG